MRKLLIIQATIVVTVAALFILRGAQPAWSALYGGAIALVNAAMLGRRVDRLAIPTTDDGRGTVLSLYIGAVQRFAFTLGAMAVGMGLFKLDPIALLVAFAAAQLSYAVVHVPKLS